MSINAYLLIGFADKFKHSPAKTSRVIGMGRNKTLIIYKIVRLEISHKQIPNFSSYTTFSID